MNKLTEEQNDILTAELCGGIGNQLFQIATAYAYSKRTMKKLCFRKFQFNGCRQGSHPTKYYNNLFEKLNFIDNIVNINIVKEKGFSYQDIIDDIHKFANKNISISGYFQSENYFKQYKKEIVNLFTPSICKENTLRDIFVEQMGLQRNIAIVNFLKLNSNIFNNFPELLSNIDNFVFIGVRRGDYITYAHCHNPCGMDYYNKAINLFNSSEHNTTYYIMSDDLEWCKEKFISDNERSRYIPSESHSVCEYKFLDIKDDLEALLVITLFKNYIIGNSSFHWWGSYLSIYEDIKIVAPDKWVNEAGYQSIYRDEMCVIERLVEID